jgi:mannose-1-phosphate guanylyltransferase/mannose-6-phosphate isomerase
MPKQFIPLRDDLSTFQLTLLRFHDDPVFAQPLVLGHNDFRFIIGDQLQQIGAKADIVLEPSRRDSAAAVAVAAYRVAATHPDALVLVLAADHLIPDAAAFCAACKDAAEAAALGHIMTLGVTPTEPATIYGYIRPDGPIQETKAHKVASFVEKPDAVRAAEYVGAGYLWNSGNFIFRSDVMIRELERFVPEIAAAAREAVAQATPDLDFVRLHTESFERAPKTSIDYAVMERTDAAGVLAVDFAWSDVGSWGAMWDVSARDAEGNATRGDVSLLETVNTLVHSDEGTLTTVVGVANLIVVATADAVLVCDRHSTDKVKTLVGRLKTAGRRETEEHLRVHRPWGWYQRVDIGPRFQVKRIMVKPGAKLSLQKHFHRAEHWVVVKGTAEVTVNDGVTLLHENEGSYIPLGAVHRLANPGRIPLEIIEVQVGTYTGEDDIVRLEDFYRRA